MLEFKVAKKSKSCPKIIHISFHSKVIIFKIVLKVTKYLGYFWAKICCQELSKIAQSGHTDCRQASSYGVARHVLDRSRGCRSRRLWGHPMISLTRIEERISPENFSDTKTNGFESRLKCHISTLHTYLCQPFGKHSKGLFTQAAFSAADCSRQLRFCRDRKFPNSALTHVRCGIRRLQHLVWMSIKINSESM